MTDANEYKYVDEGKKHLHTLRSVPLIGTSTVVSVLAKPLTWWASGMACAKFGWMNPKPKVNGKYVTVSKTKLLEVANEARNEIANLDDGGYLALLDEAYRAHNEYKNERADSGTNRHSLLESYVKECIADDGHPRMGTYDIAIQDFVQWSWANVKKFLWSELYCYSELMWTGGIADVGWEDNDGNIVAGDFKSSKEAYMDQYLQIAGYDMAISENGGLTKDGEKIFDLPKPITKYCVIPFGSDPLTPEFKEDIEQYKIGFEAALELHKLSTKFNQ